MKSARSLTTVLIVSGALAFAYCGESETQLIENPTAEEFHLGSLVYANENCSNCHGIDWDGVGAPEAASLKAAGTPVPNFLKMKDPQKTPVDYFKAMTMGTDKMPEHRYQHVTDRGRWAAAHFLFSLAPALRGSKADQRTLAITNAFAEAREAYARTEAQGKRRWELGYKPYGEREPTPDLDALLKETGTTPAAPGEATPPADGEAGE